MPLIFPTAPTVGQTYVSGGTTWSWDGSSWSSSGVGSDKVSRLGDTMLGALALPSVAPSDANHATRKGYVDGLVLSSGYGTPVSRTGGVTLMAGDLGPPQVFSITATATVNLPALAGVAPGTTTKIDNLAASTAHVLIDPDGTETINGRTTFVLFPGESGELVATATGWVLFGVTDSGWREFSTVLANASAAIDWVFPPGFAWFRFEMSGVRPVTDGASLVFRTSTDLGVNFDAGASDYTLQLIGGAPGNAAFGAITSALDNAATETSMATMEFFPGGNGSRGLALIVNAHQNNGTPAQDTQVRSSRRNSTTAANAIRFFMTTGNIAVGRFTAFARY